MFSIVKTVGLIGRTNVGKSTLFNRLIKSKKAIVSDIAGTTRDFLEGVVEMDGKSFQLIDFGGVDFSASGKIEEKVREKVLENIDQLDLVVFVVDGDADISQQDLKITEILRKKNKQTVLAVNKVDHEKRDGKAYEFYSLGFDKTVFISAIHGRGVGDLLEVVAKELKLKSSKKGQEEFFKIAIIGRPNVGKSSLFNILCGKDRSIVSDIAGTTRDAVDINVAIDGDSYTFIDTAGLKRKVRVAEGLDKTSSYEAIASIKKADLVLYMVDASEYAVSYDINLLSFIFREGKSVVVIVNKWDLKKDQLAEKQYREALCADNSIFKKMPIIFTSALKGYGIEKISQAIREIKEISEQRINTSRLNRELKKISESMTGIRGKIFYATQTNSFPCEFIIFVKRKQSFKAQQLEFIESRLREKFGLSGVAIRLFLREREH